MASHNRCRAGGKFAKSHTTVLTGAGEVADIAHACPVVSKIILAHINTSRSGSNGQRRVKLFRDQNALRMLVIDGAGHQTIYVHASDILAAAEYVKERAEDRGFRVELML